MKTNIFHYLVIVLLTLGIGWQINKIFEDPIQRGRKIRIENYTSESHHDKKLLYFFSKDCPKCISDLPILETISSNKTTFKNTDFFLVPFKEINTDSTSLKIIENKKLIRKFKIKSVPKYILIKDNEIKYITGRIENIIKYEHEKLLK
jgi:thiol-disulfide isomerase/thioredoxin